MLSFWLSIVLMAGRIFLRPSSSCMLSQAISVVRPACRTMELPLSVYSPWMLLQFVVMEYLPFSNVIPALPFFSSAGRKFIESPIATCSIFHCPSISGVVSGAVWAACGSASEAESATVFWVVVPQAQVMRLRVTKE